MTVTPLFREPTVEEMLADPIVRMIMQRDGVEEAELRRTLRRLAEARTGRSDGRGELRPLGRPNPRPEAAA